MLAAAGCSSQTADDACRQATAAIQLLQEAAGPRDPDWLRAAAGNAHRHWMDRYTRDQDANYWLRRCVSASMACVMAADSLRPLAAEGSSARQRRVQRVQVAVSWLGCVVLSAWLRMTPAHDPRVAVVVARHEQLCVEQRVREAQAWRNRTVQAAWLRNPGLPAPLRARAAAQDVAAWLCRVAVRSWPRSALLQPACSERKRKRAAPRRLRVVLLQDGTGRMLRRVSFVDAAQ